MLLWLIFALVMLFGFAAFRGAPYVPTHRKQVELALDLLDLKPGEVLVDLGSGDGILLKAAARRGIVAHGYEINPILCVISYIRCWKYRALVHVHLRDFWLTPLPAGTKGVFTFLAKPYMKKFERKLSSVKGGLRVVSYGFELPGRKPVKSAEGLHLYKI